jgi:hypothetical protein
LTSGRNTAGDFTMLSSYREFVKNPRCNAQLASQTTEKERGFSCELDGGILQMIIILKTDKSFYEFTLSADSYFVVKRGAASTLKET